LKYKASALKWKEDELSPYLPFDADIRGFASSESAFIATAFLKLFMALPPTLAALAALVVRLGLAWLEDTKSKFQQIYIQGKEPFLSNIDFSVWFSSSKYLLGSSDHSLKVVLNKICYDEEYFSWPKQTLINVVAIQVTDKGIFVMNWFTLFCRIV